MLNRQTRTKSASLVAHKPVLCSALLCLPLQIGVYSVACSQLSAPRVQLDLAAAEQQRQQLAAAAAAAAEAQGLGPARRGGPAGVPPRAPGAVGVSGLVPLHLTRIEVENVQSYSFALPGLLAWLLGAKSGALQVGRAGA